VGAVNSAQRNPHNLPNCGLRHSALAQQHHLDALTLYHWDFPPQRCFQLTDLLLGTLGHPPPESSDSQRESHSSLAREPEKQTKPAIQSAMEAV
jgi:hypothetical protein